MLFYYQYFKYLLTILLSTGCSDISKQSPETIEKPNSIWSAEWSVDGKYIALGGDDSTVWIYKGDDQMLYRSFKANSMVKGLRWHPKENVLAIANTKGIQLLVMETETLTTVTAVTVGGRAIGWNYTGELLALADGSGMIRILDKNGKLVRSISKEDRKSFLSIDWHPSENIILTGGDEIRLFDTSGKQLHMFRIRDQNTGILSVKWHPSGEFFARGDYGHENEGIPTLLQFWKKDGTKLNEIRGHHGEIRNLRWSPDGRFVATAADSLRVWTKNGELVGSGASKHTLWGVAWSKDSKFIVTASYADGEIKFWDNKAKLVKKIN